ncbi:hypothetical protein [Streptomyces sp. NPDC058595]|uniref:hypothetical protein n=1 Tax=Streptomyces sp. NPDC058595 TaxID=3346550 RepID=UPI0036531070
MPDQPTPQGSKNAPRVPRRAKSNEQPRKVRCEDCGDMVEVEARFRTLCSCDAAE